MNDQRQIVALMSFAVLFSLIGHTIKVKNQPNTGAGADVKIILGGGLATVLLALLAEAGDPGDKLAKGLAVIALVSSILINGASVFGGVNKLTSKTTPVPTLTSTAKVG